MIGCVFLAFLDHLLDWMGDIGGLGGGPIFHWVWRLIRRAAAMATKTATAAATVAASVAATASMAPTVSATVAATVMATVTATDAVSAARAASPTYVSSNASWAPGLHFFPFFTRVTLPKSSSPFVSELSSLTLAFPF